MPGRRKGRRKLVGPGIGRRKTSIKVCGYRNWIQCREKTKETVCGKWRRAPLFEIQTDNWDCSCSVLWDPIHADCAVPQELETSEVMKQLEHVNSLRHRLADKR